jgi:hypothetical protein
MVVLITHVVEADGRDRMVDIHRGHRAHPDRKWTRLIYWGITSRMTTTEMRWA